MADSKNPKSGASAEKAYAAAAAASGSGAVGKAPAPVAVELVDEPLEFPSKPKRGRKSRPDFAAQPDAVAAAPAIVLPAIVLPVVAPPVAAAPVVAPLAGKTTKPVKAIARGAPKPSRRELAKAAKAPAAKPAPAKVVLAKSIPTKLAPAKLPSLKLPSVNATAIKRASRAVIAKIKIAPQVSPEPASPAAADSFPFPFIAQLKEIPMDVTSSIKDAVSGAQEKAKEAFTKTSAAATEYGEFAKGNAEAFVESGKILASGLKALGTTIVADGKSAFETASADVKSLTSVKSPTDLFQLQSDLLRRNFDSAVAFGSKTSEAMMKLTNDMMAPISTRVNLAVEKIKTVA
jgi:phasin family protein